MTHIELMDRPGGGMFPPIVVRDRPRDPGRPCDGAVEVERVWTDDVLAVHGGVPERHSIELYRCETCDARVIYDATAGHILNQYRPAGGAETVRELVEDLARTFHLPDSGGEAE